MVEIFGNFRLRILSAAVVKVIKLSVRKNFALRRVTKNIYKQMAENKHNQLDLWFTVMI
jgi:hypothetical protein